MLVSYKLYFDKSGRKDLHFVFKIENFISNFLNEDRYFAMDE